MSEEFAEDVEADERLEADGPVEVVELEDELDDEPEAAEPETAELADRPVETGDPRVDDALALLDDLDALPTSDHVAVFDDVQRRLQSALTHSDADSGTGS
jgi:hypothetical protein